MTYFDSFYLLFKPHFVSNGAHAVNKRVLALGGAKNHLLALPDCDTAMASRDIVASFAGCCGQRCMHRVLDYINEAEAAGSEILLDGRSWATERTQGFWVGPTILLHSSAEDRAMKEEIFGPVLSVYCASSWEEAIAIENSNPYGNAACIYTEKGANAEWFLTRFRAGLQGINVAFPSSEGAFCYGGMFGTKSQFGDCDIAGEGPLEFFSTPVKVISNWSTFGVVSHLALSSGAAQPRSIVTAGAQSSVRAWTVNKSKDEGEDSNSGKIQPHPPSNHTKRNSHALLSPDSRDFVPGSAMVVQSAIPSSSSSTVPLGGAASQISSASLGLSYTSSEFQSYSPSLPNLHTGSRNSHIAIGGGGEGKGFFDASSSTDYFGESCMSSAAAPSDNFSNQNQNHAHHA